MLSLCFFTTSRRHPAVVVDHGHRNILAGDAHTHRVVRSRIRRHSVRVLARARRIHLVHRVHGPDRSRKALHLHRRIPHLSHRTGWKTKHDCQKIEGLCGQQGAGSSRTRPKRKSNCSVGSR